MTSGRSATNILTRWDKCVILTAYAAEEMLANAWLPLLAQNDVHLDEAHLRAITLGVFLSQR